MDIRARLCIAIMLFAMWACGTSGPDCTTDARAVALDEATALEMTSEEAYAALDVELSVVASYEAGGTTRATLTVLARRPGPLPAECAGCSGAACDRCTVYPREVSERSLAAGTVGCDEEWLELGTGTLRLRTEDGLIDHSWSDAMTIWSSLDGAFMYFYLRVGPSPGLDGGWAPPAGADAVFELRLAAERVGGVLQMQIASIEIRSERALSPDGPFERTPLLTFAR